MKKNKNNSRNPKSSNSAKRNESANPKQKAESVCLIQETGVTNMKTLDELMESAKKYGEDCIRSSGGFDPTLFHFGKKGLIKVVAYIANGDQGKDTFAKVATLSCKSNDATMCACVSNVWVAGITPSKESGTFTAPSQCPDRREMIFVSGESHSEGQKIILLPVNRGANGKFSDFGAPLVLDTNETQCGGRYAQYLPK